MTAYYNEIDLYAAQWLRNLIAAGHIAPGDVDTRSIEQVQPDDLRKYTQCHFFAGIGVWSHSLRAAGWDDSRPVWTGSCPCQPFSAAGKGAGFNDSRHLWPVWKRLIDECGPSVVLGEQVASKDADPWIDLVCDDMESMGYAFGAIPFPSAGVGAPHIRDRLYWMAYAERFGISGGGSGVVAGASGEASGQAWQQRVWPDAGPECCTESHRMANSASEGFQGGQSGGQRPDTQLAAFERGRKAGRLADGGGERRVGRERLSAGCVDDRQDARRVKSDDGFVGRNETGIQRGLAAGPTNGLWGGADWLACRDGKWRPVEPGTFPLAHGATSRVGRLRAYGNAVNAEAARIWIETVMEAL